MAGRVTGLLARTNNGFLRSSASLLNASTACSLNGMSSSPALCSSDSYTKVEQSSLVRRTAATKTASWIRPNFFESGEKENEKMGKGMSVGLAAGLFSFTVLAEEAEAEEEKFTKEDSARVVEEADRLYKEKKMKEAYSLLEKYNKCVDDDVETAWRHARAAYECAQTEPERSPRRKELIYQSRDIARHSLEINANHHQTQKWNGISTSAVANFEGTTSKIELSYVIKAHFEKVIELAPSDPYGHFLLGKWQYTFAEMPWYTRQLASTFFATPPSATFEEALASFLKAEETQPDFYLDNQLMIAKCLLEVGRKEEAREWLEKVAKTEAAYFNDHDVIRQATESLRSL